MASTAATLGTLDGVVNSESPKVAALENLQEQSHNTKRKIDVTQLKQIRRM